MASQNQSGQEREIDARTFQYKLDELATTIAFKVEREAPQLGLRPAFLAADLYYLVRQAQQTYNLFFFVNADKRRLEEYDWRTAYPVVMLPLVRTMIDCLYNVTRLLENPGPNAFLFRSSGYRLRLLALDADEKRYGGDPRWDEWIARQRNAIDIGMRKDGFTESQVRADRGLWPTLSRYLSADAGNPLTPHQEFLKKLTFGFWQEYSGISHATFQGLMPIALFLAPRDLPHEDRPKLDEAVEAMIAIHIPRVSAILLCILTEIQASLHFDGARINQRLHEIWNVLVVAPEVRGLYNERYLNLMKDKGINAE